VRYKLSQLGLVITVQRVLLTFVALLLLFACGTKDESSLQIAGSTSLQPALEIVGEAFYRTSGVTVRVQGGGSTAGVQSVVEGVVPVGAISRRLTSDETSQGLIEHIIAYDVLTVVVHPENTIEALTRSQIAALFSGTVTDWSQIGGAAGRTHLITREAGSGSREAFRSLIGSISPRAIVQGSSGAIRVAVMHDRQAIGYVSYGTLAAGGLKAVTVGGKRPSDPGYPLIRPLSLVTLGPATGHVTQLIDFVRGPEGKRLLHEEGLVSAQ